MESEPGLAVLSFLGLIAIAYVSASLVARLARLALAAAARRELAAADPALRRPARIAGTATFIVVAAVLAGPAVRMAGLDLDAGLSPEALTTWLLGSGLRIVIIVTGSYVVVRIVDLTARRLEQHIEREAAPDAVERGRRARTISRLVRNALRTVTITVALLMVLRELRIDITPILTGAGIVGLAVGFGAQALVRDIISGFFLIVENQLRVGDAARINGTEGTVEQINLRTVVLRDDEGTVHVFPNGLITQLANRSKDYAYAVLDLGVAAHHRLDEVTAALQEAGERLRRRPDLGPAILDPLEVMGIQAFRAGQIVVRVRVRTQPLRQWQVTRELLGQVKNVFEERGISAA
ncbi:MAG: mechanosensitive ion channel [Acidobacteriota bacterium]|jgi:small-conductance mechanosensitive channel